MNQKAARAAYTKAYHDLRTIARESYKHGLSYFECEGLLEEYVNVPLERELDDIEQWQMRLRARQSLYMPIAQSEEGYLLLSAIDSRRLAVHYAEAGRDTVTQGYIETARKQWLHLKRLRAFKGSERRVRDGLRRAEREAERKMQIAT